MMLRQLPFARGHATIICPFYPATRPGVRRFKPHVAVCIARLFTTTLTSDGDAPAAMLDECFAQATFFDRAALLPWAMGCLGRLQLHRLKSASVAATWQQQMETVKALQSLGFISERQALTLEHDLQTCLLQSHAVSTQAKSMTRTAQSATPRTCPGTRLPEGQRKRRTIGARHNARSALRSGTPAVHRP